MSRWGRIWIDPPAQIDLLEHRIVSDAGELTIEGRFRIRFSRSIDRVRFDAQLYFELLLVSEGHEDVKTIFAGSEHRLRIVCFGVAGLDFPRRLTYELKMPWVTH